MEIGGNLGTAFASRSPKAASSSLPEPEVINFYNTVKDNAWANVSNLCYINGANTQKLYPSTPHENIDLEQPLKKEWFK